MQAMVLNMGPLEEMLVCWMNRASVKENNGGASVGRKQGEILLNDLIDRVTIVLVTVLLLPIAGMAKLN